MKKIKIASVATSALLCLSVLSFSAAPANAAADRSGKPCYVQGQVFSSGGLTVTCSNETGKLVYTKAKKLSGSLTVVCGATEAWCAAMTEAFTKKTGVTTKFVRLSSGETVARLDAAKSNPEFDVWHGGPADGFGVARINGLIDKYTLVHLDSVQIQRSSSALEQRFLPHGPIFLSLSLRRTSQLHTLQHQERHSQLSGHRSPALVEKPKEWSTWRSSTTTSCNTQSQVLAQLPLPDAVKLPLVSCSHMTALLDKSKVFH
jgi:hypothetical protein